MQKTTANNYREAYQRKKRFSDNEKEGFLYFENERSGHIKTPFSCFVDSEHRLVFFNVEFLPLENTYKVLRYCFSKTEKQYHFSARTLFAHDLPIDISFEICNATPMPHQKSELFLEGCRTFAKEIEKDEVPVHCF